MRPLFLGGLLMALFLIGCEEVALHHNLMEPEADKILVLLDDNAITAKKKKEVEGQEVSWTVIVSQSDAARARRLLVENNLPARLELGLSGVYREKGLIPTPDEQRARFLLAQKGEIVNALRTIPGVYEVGVVLNIPEEKELLVDTEKRPRPSASVTLRIADPTSLKTELTEEKIRRFVANAIPDMAPNDVVVIISSDTDMVLPVARSHKTSGIVAPESEIPPEVGETGGPEVTMVEVAGIRLEGNSLKRFKFYLFVFLCVLIIISAALLVTLFRMSRLRRSVGGRRVKAIPVEGGHGGQDLLSGG